MPQFGIIGWGADAGVEKRPRVPEERHPPRPLVDVSGVPVQQMGRPSAKSRHRALAPVYGTAVPLRGLSGVIRRIAYEVPDYKPRRWMLLMLADRVDVMEHNALPLTLGLGAIAAVVLGSARYRSADLKRCERGRLDDIREVLLFGTIEVVPERAPLPTGTRARARCRRGW